MGRRWIMVELGDHRDDTHRAAAQEVIEGQDPGGVTEAVGWKGGGGFRMFRLAPSLIEEDQFGQKIISKQYNAAMLAEAMCKHMGYTYAPSTDAALYWQQGHATERDFIYTTTQSLTHDALKALSLEVGPKRTLLVCCKAFRARLGDFRNLAPSKRSRKPYSKTASGAVTTTRSTSPSRPRTPLPPRTTSPMMTMATAASPPPSRGAALAASPRPRRWPKLMPRRRRRLR